MAYETVFLRDVGQSIFRPRDTRPIYSWAGDNVSLGGAYTLTGRFDISNSPWLREPFEALTDESIRVVWIRGPVRSAKSLIADVWLPWVIANDPGPFMWNMQTDKIAERHATDRIMPTLEGCPPAAEMFSDDRHDKQKMEIVFANGMHLYVQGPSIGNLQSVGIRYQVNDEFWMWAPGRLNQAMARTGDFEELGISKVLNVSQCGDEEDEEDQGYRSGDQREWQVPCLECKTHFFPELLGLNAAGKKSFLTWSEAPEMKDAQGNWILGRVLPTLSYLCPHCGAAHQDNKSTRRAWNAGGRYLAKNPDAAKDTRSFRWSGLCTRSWTKLLQEYLGAMNALRLGVLEQLKIFTQKRLPRPWSEKELYDAFPRKVFEATPEEWKEEHVRFMAIDRQAVGKRWVLVAAVSKKGEMRRLWYGPLYSEEECSAKAAEFKVQPTRVCEDCGFEQTKTFAECVRQNWTALWGADAENFPWTGRTSKGQPITILRSYSRTQKGDPGIGQTFAGRRFARFIRWSNPRIKDKLKGQIELGLLVDPNTDAGDPMEIQYRRQMRSEYKKRAVDKRTGRIKEFWYRSSKENHAWDCWCMIVVLATIMGLLPDIQAAPAPAAKVDSVQQSTDASDVAPNSGEPG